MKNKKIHKAADAFLRTIDAAPIGSGTVLKDDTRKEWMETSAHRALGKLEAATYHSENVSRLVEETRKNVKAPSIDGTLEMGAGVNATMRRTSMFPVQEIAYEIEAFLAASRAAVDFIANIIALHLGMTRRTGVTTVVEWLTKNANPSLAFMLERRSWIEHLKAYRDECVHYRTIRARIGYEEVHQKRVATEASMPCVIPEDILLSTTVQIHVPGEHLKAF